MLGTIYDDVNNNKPTMKFLDSTRVSEVNKLAERLYEIARFMSSSSRRSATEIANTIKSLALPSRYSIRYIERAAYEIKNLKPKGAQPNTKMDKALAEAALVYISYNKTSSNKGKNGYIIGTRDYCDNIMKGVFCGGFCTSSDYDPLKTNKTTIQKQTEKLLAKIRSDIKGKHGTDKYMEHNERERILALGNALISYCSTNVINGLSSDLKKLQRLEDHNHRVINIDLQGFMFPVDAKLCWEKGVNVLYLTANIFFTFLNPLDRIEELIRPSELDSRKMHTMNAFKEWGNGGNPYHNVFTDQSVKVVMTLKETSNPYDAVKVYLDMPVNTSIGWGGVGVIGWEPHANKVIMLADANTPNGTATHEFGHILGLGDAYAAKAIPGIYYGFGVDETLYPDAKQSVMNKYQDSPTSNDIEMVIYAFYTGKRQNFQKESFWSDISPVLGK